jgi:hypothetical protein
LCNSSTVTPADYRPCLLPVAWAPAAAALVHSASHTSARDSVEASDRPLIQAAIASSERQLGELAQQART